MSEDRSQTDISSGNTELYLQTKTKKIISQKKKVMIFYPTRAFKILLLCIILYRLESKTPVFNQELFKYIWNQNHN